MANEQDQEQKNKSTDFEGFGSSATSSASSSGSSGSDDEGVGPKLAEALRKIVAGGLGAAFMTEESVRHYLSELKLPKDVLTTLLQSAGKSKEELVTKVGNEVIKLVNKIDFVKEASRFVEEHKFRITAEVDVVRKDMDSRATHSESERTSTLQWKASRSSGSTQGTKKD